MEEKKPTASAKRVKIKTMRPILVDVHQDPKTGMVQGTIVPEGKEVEVSEEEARLHCDSKFEGYWAFAGDRYDDNPRHTCQRAIRI